jgi:tRNA (guanine-N7-)-methyltransferase
VGKDRSGRQPAEGSLSATDRALYGRRVGRSMRGRALHAAEAVLPRLRLTLPETGEFDPFAIFGRPVRAVWVEIGAGNGSHAVWQAAQNPDIGLIAVEPFLNGVAALAADADDLGLDNIRVLDDDARLLLALLPPASIERTFIIHPDPWPKRRHWRRRIVCDPVLDLLAQLMPVGAELRVGTDDVAYLVWMLRVLRAHPAFAWAPDTADSWRVRPADWPQTRFEEKGMAVGRRSTYLSLRRQVTAEETLNLEFSEASRYKQFQ